MSSSQASFAAIGSSPPQGNQRVYQTFQELVQEPETFLRQICVPQVNHLQFILNGIPFQVSVTPSDAGWHLCIWATLGNLPYSAESPEKRHSLVYILNSAHFLSIAKLGVDQEMRIVIRGDFIVKSIDLPAFIFPPLVVFWQDARPFVDLIGSFL